MRWTSNGTQDFHVVGFGRASESIQHKFGLYNNLFWAHGMYSRLPGHQKRTKNTFF
ncbi:hypothetical protein [Methylomonas albis]|nr:hypothetical protein [Methylomonas albis]